jgi:hypothetical protein
MGSAETTVSGFTQISPEVLAKLTALSADLSSTHDLDLLLNRIMSEARRIGPSRGWQHIPFKGRPPALLLRAK